MLSLFCLTAVCAVTAATPLYYDGRAPLNLSEADLDASVGPYLTAVKGATQNASHYDTLLGDSILPTPLWNTSEQPVRITIDNTSIFVPGGGAPQNGFRRTELIAQPANCDHDALNAVMEVGKSVFHFSIMMDEERPLNYSHEYQIVFIEPSDGTHVFGIQLGSPFTNPTGVLPAPNANSFKVLDHSLNVLYTAPFTAQTWHNFAVQVDWDNLTLGVLYSTNASTLTAVTDVVPNSGASAGAAGQGDFHCGVLKLPLVNPADSTANQGDVVHFGIQEGDTEALIYSGIFVEDAAGGVSTGFGTTVSALV